MQSPVLQSRPLPPLQTNIDKGRRLHLGDSRADPATKRGVRGELQVRGVKGQGHRRALCHRRVEPQCPPRVHMLTPKLHTRGEARRTRLSFRPPGLSSPRIKIPPKKYRYKGGTVCSFGIVPRKYNHFPFRTTKYLLYRIKTSTDGYSIAGLGYNCMCL